MEGWLQATETRERGEKVLLTSGSMTAAIKVLQQAPGRRWLVMGDLAELGDAAAVLGHIVARRPHHNTNRPGLFNCRFQRAVCAASCRSAARTSGRCRRRS